MALIALDCAVPLLLPDIGPLVMRDPVLGWRAQPYADCCDYTTLIKDHRIVRYQIGSWGERRNRLDVEPRVRHHHLVLCFGDSMTFG